MYEYGQIVKIKNDLTIGRRYGALVYTEHHAKLYGKLLNVYKISSSGSYYLAEGDIKHGTTFSQEMLETPMFVIGEKVRIIKPNGMTYPPMTTAMLDKVGDTGEIKGLFLRRNFFTYILDTDNINVYPQESLSYLTTEKLDESFKTLDDEIYGDKNQLQDKDPHISIGARVKGSRVHGWHSKASIRSRPLRDPKSVRGK